MTTTWQFFWKPRILGAGCYVPHVNLLTPGRESKIWYGSLRSDPCIWNGLDHQHFAMDREQWSLLHSGNCASLLNWAISDIYLQRQAMTWRKERSPTLGLWVPQSTFHFQKCWSFAVPGQPPPYVPLLIPGQLPKHPVSSSTKFSKTPSAAWQQECKAGLCVSRVTKLALGAPLSCLLDVLRPWGVQRRKLRNPCKLQSSLMKRFHRPFLLSTPDTQAEALLARPVISSSLNSMPQNDIKPLYEVSRIVGKPQGDLVKKSSSGPA